VKVFIGALVDGIEWNIVDHNRSCYSPYSNNYYGQTAYFEQAYNCYDSLKFSSPGYCYCVEANNNICFHYDISQYNHYNCGDVLGYYTTQVYRCSYSLIAIMVIDNIFNLKFQLQLSTTFCSILVPLCLFFIVISSTFMCMICCRRQVPERNDAASAEITTSPIVYMVEAQSSSNTVGAASAPVPSKA
jgi:hypothetical protein